MAGPDLDDNDRRGLLLGGLVTLDHTGHVVFWTVDLGHAVAVLQEGVSGLARVVQGIVDVLERPILVAILIPRISHSRVPVLSV
jgi:hypothetical protein